MSRQLECRLQLIAKAKHWPSSNRGLLSTTILRVSYLPSSMTCGDYSIQSTVDSNEDNVDELEVESQDKEDIGYGSRPSGGFTSTVSTQNSH